MDERLIAALETIVSSVSNAKTQTNNESNSEQRVLEIHQQVVRMQEENFIIQEKQAFQLQKLQQQLVQLQLQLDNSLSFSSLDRSSSPTPLLHCENSDSREDLLAKSNSAYSIGSYEGSPYLQQEDDGDDDNSDPTTPSTKTPTSEETLECDPNSFRVNNSPDVVRLNVGGMKFSTTLTTLQRLGESSMLSAMFSGRFGLSEQNLTPKSRTRRSDEHEQHEKMNENSFFIDRDGTYFRFILNYLRGSSHHIQLPHDKHQLEEFLEECEFYQIQPLIQAVKTKLFEFQRQSTSSHRKHLKDKKNGSQIVIVTFKPFGATIVGTTDLCFFGTTFSETDPNFRNLLRKISFASDYVINVQVSLNDLQRATLFQTLENNNFHLIFVNKSEYIFKKAAAGTEEPHK